MSKEQSGNNGKKSKKTGFFLFLSFLAFVVAPIIIANFVPGGDEFLTNVGVRVVVPLVIAMVITKIMHGKHFSVFENDEADRYLKKDSVVITERYDKYSHTT